MHLVSVAHRPICDLVAGSAPDEWLSTGHDPQFELDIPPSLGARFLLVLNGFESIERLPLCPVLYVDSGSGYAEHTSIPLCGPRRGRVAASIELRSRPIRLRLDPAVEPGRFALGSVEIGRRDGGSVIGTAIRRWTTRPTDERLNPPWLPQRAHAKRTSEPRISVLMPVRDTVPTFLDQAVQSVLDQAHANLELCIVDDGSAHRWITRWLRSCAAGDRRVRLARHERSRGIAAATNRALEMATGSYVALVDHDDVLHPSALSKVAQRLEAGPETDFIYTDEDRIDAAGRHFTPLVKPDWSPEYLTGVMYTNHLSVYRAQLVRDVGGFCTAFDGAQDYDLALRVALRTNRVEHIPEILYHWRVWSHSTSSGYHAKPDAESRGRAAVADYLRSAGLRARVERGARTGYQRPRIAVDGEPLVSVVVHGAAERGGAAVEAMRLALSSYPKLEVIVVETRDPLALIDAVWHSHGAHVMLLDASAEIRTPDALKELLMYSQLPGIGAVGARICDRDGLLREAGVPSDALLNGQPTPRDPSRASFDRIQRNVSVISFTCLMMRAVAFKTVGGFDPCLHGHLAAADYCLRLQREGWRTVFTPYVEAWIVEVGASPATVESAHERQIFQSRWPQAVERDPYFPRAPAHRPP